jgi:hypothetical protein
MGGAAAGAQAAPQFRSTFLRALPPARLVWLFLGGLGGYSLDYLHGLGLASLLFVPLIAALVDLVFQRVRFEHLRFPDAALATGLFVALVLPPTASLLFTGIGVLAAIASRHVLRYAGHPWFNPAAVGILFGAFAFGLAPAWWAGVGPFGEYLVVALGLLLIARSPGQWRLPATFLASYAVLATVQHVLFGATTDPHVLFLQATDPTTLFFALFMAAEPRTAPSSHAAQPLYAGAIGTVAAFGPLFSPTAGLLLALVAGNLIALLLRRAERAHAAAPSSTKPRRKPALTPRWSASRRAGAGVVVGIILLGAIAAMPVEHSAPILVAGLPSGLGGSGGSGCTTDNSSISASDLHQLHQILGPSVILSYNSASGLVVFYDPVNKVTVTETDLYEDYGFAEFNGDDYAVSGCSG